MVDLMDDLHAADTDVVSDAAEEPGGTVLAPGEAGLDLLVQPGGGVILSEGISMKEQ
jgi:hypothetical protein